VRGDQDGAADLAENLLGALLPGGTISRISSMSSGTAMTSSAAPAPRSPRQGQA
jgi:hypothetical protein